MKMLLLLLGWCEKCEGKFLIRNLHHIHETHFKDMTFGVSYSLQLAYKGSVSVACFCIQTHQGFQIDQRVWQNTPGNVFVYHSYHPVSKQPDRDMWIMGLLHPNHPTLMYIKELLIKVFGIKAKGHLHPASAYLDTLYALGAHVLLSLNPLINSTLSYTPGGISASQEPC